jgi:uncharacterized protein (TIGR02284 family)
MKPMKNSEVISVVRDLIQILEDGREGFRLAADAIDNSDLKKLFTHYSEQHAQFATDLHNLSRGFGDPAYDQNGSLESTFHRGRLNLMSAIGTNDPAAILAECERGEEHAVSEYRKALDRSLPIEIQHALEAQGLELTASHDKVRRLRNARWTRKKLAVTPI